MSLMYRTWDDVRQLLAGAFAGRPRRTLAKFRQAINELERAAVLPAEVSVETIGHLKTAMTARGCEPETINSLLGAARGITKILRAYGALEVDPFSVGVSFRLKSKTPWQRTDKHHSLEQIRRLLALADDEYERAVGLMPRFKAGRLRALAWLVSHTGLRAQEALCARRARWDGRFLEIRHEDQPEQRLKTESSERVVAVPRAAAERLDEWAITLEGYTCLFPCVSQDTPWINGRTEYRASGHVQALGQRAGVEGVTLLSLRHSYQTHARTAWGLSAGEVALVVGHSSTATQRNYLHEDRENLAQLARAVSFS